MAKPSWQDIVPRSGRAFVKMQGLHNHFVIVDGRESPYRPSPAESVRICDVKTGVGGDQLLVIEPPTPEGARAGAHAFMRIINIDGRDAEACGNATRCFGWLMLEETGRDEIVLETVVGPLRCSREGDKQVAVEMGPITAAWDEIPLSRPVDTLHLPIESGPLRDGVALNIGNPHALFIVEDLAALDLVRFAAPVQRDPLFPDSVNVGAMEILRDDHLRLSVYERPGLLTTACGSGACVASRALQLRGLTDKSRFTVEMAAGAVQIEIRDDGSAVMAGPVEFCFSGTLSGLEGGA